MYVIEAFQDVVKFLAISHSVMCNVPVAGITLFNFEQEKGLVILQYIDFMVSQGHLSEWNL